MDSELVREAREALGAAYAPYSEYRVGAALRAVDGTVYTGCNIENANYSNSLHAEEVAVGRAVADGTRTFEALAVTSARRDGVTPCGMCRQTLAEFCDEDFPVYCDEGDGDSAPSSDDDVEGDTVDGDGDSADGKGDTVDGDGDSADGKGDTVDIDASTYRLGDLLPETITARHLGVDA